MNKKYKLLNITINLVCFYWNERIHQTRKANRVSRQSKKIKFITLELRQELPEIVEDKLAGMET
jgi:hypothetical protein